MCEKRLEPMSKNKGNDHMELKDLRPIVVRSHVAKILEKAIMERVAAVGPEPAANENILDWI